MSFFNSMLDTGSSVIGDRLQLGATSLAFGAFFKIIEILEEKERNKALKYASSEDATKEDEQGRIPLHFAALLGRKDLAELQIINGADVNHQDKQGVNPLYIAAIGGHVKVSKLLIESGADVNFTDSEGQTLLKWIGKEDSSWLKFLSSENDNREYTRKLAKLLISNGADVHSEMVPGVAPLHWAARNGYTDIVRLLIEKGADVNAEGKRNWTSLHWAKHNGHKEVVKLLRDCKAVNSSRHIVSLKNIIKFFKDPEKEGVEFDIFGCCILVIITITVLFVLLIMLLYSPILF